MAAHKFRELKVWQRSIAFVARVYKVSAAFPPAEQFGLTSQLRRAATSIPLNIAEGAGSGTDSEFRRFLRISFRSTYEVMTILEVASTLGFVQEPAHGELAQEADELAAMLYSLIERISANIR
jgi:four helix bundle protein